MKRHNSSHAIAKIEGGILTGFNSNHYSLALCIDRNKAFDIVNNEILLDTSESYGTRKIELV